MYFVFTWPLPSFLLEPETGNHMELFQDFVFTWPMLGIVEHLMTPSKPTPPWKTTLDAVIKNISDDPGHPLQIALRTYSLCLSLALSPAFLPAILALAVRPKSFTARARVFYRALSRELRPTGFASAITAAVGGGAALQRLWHVLERRHVLYWPWVRYITSKLSRWQKTFLANVISSTIAVILLRWTRYRRLAPVSPTLDLSLLFLVRALDASVQAFLLQKAREIAARRPSRNATLHDTRLLDKRSEDLAKEWHNKVAMYIDGFVFWASSARFVTAHPTVPGRLFLYQRIMWCFFYQPQR